MLVYDQKKSNNDEPIKVKDIKKISFRCEYDWKFLDF